MDNVLRRGLTVLLAAVLMLSAAGCGARQAKEETIGRVETTEEEPTTRRDRTTREEITEEPETSTEALTEAPVETEAPTTEEVTTTEEETTTEEATTAAPVALRDPEAIIDTTTTLYTYAKMQDDLQYLAAAYPDICHLYSAGKTEDGRDLWYVIFGNPEAERQIYICAATHAREYMTAQLVMRQLAFYCSSYETGNYNGIPFTEIFDKTCFYVEPMVNPDGVTISQLGEEGLYRQDLRENLRAIFQSDVNNGTAETTDYARYLVRWKANALGVDINRNYPPGWETVHERSVPASTHYKGTAPFSERETKAQVAIVESMSNPLMAISYHSYGDLVYWQYAQPEPLWSANQALAQHISNMTGQYLAGYSNEAGFSNWCILEKGILSVTVETGTVSAPLPLDQFPELWSEHKYIWPMLAVTY